MRIRRHWARETAEVARPRGQAWRLAAWGGSPESREDARRRAREALAAIVRRAEAGEDLEHYPYSDRPLREEIVHEVDTGGTEPRAVITRNSYGSLVLNTRDAMFIDVDLPDAPLRSLGRAIGSLLGRKRDSEDAPGLDRVRSAAERFPDMGLRVYRTRKGLRCLVTSGTHEPSGSTTTEILTAFGSDPLYIRLCSAQECFRARLTPKHWRIGAPRPPARWPWAGAEDERRHREWVREYDEKAARFTTCELVTAIGPPRIAPEIEPIVTLHDRYVLSPTGTVLA
jgi:hypothetical protein